MNHELTHLDLFSGIGGFALAAQRAGFRTVGFSEIDPYACRILAKRFPGVPNLGNIRHRNAFSGLGNVTIVTGGYPCQPFSTAGRRAGKDDDRHLWPAMRDIIEVVRPTWIICENVSGHVTLGLDQVLSDLESDGYAAQPFVIPACAVDASHRRDRVWILCSDTRRDTRTKQKRQHEGAKVSLGSSKDSMESRNDVANAVCQRSERLRNEPNQSSATGQGRTDCETDCEPRIVDNAKMHDGGCVPKRSKTLRPDFTGEDVADSISQRQSGQGQSGQGQSGQRVRQEEDRERQANHALAVSQPAIWEPEPELGRVAYGIPNSMDRLKGLGNAIVPQVAEPFFHWIGQIERGEVDP